MELTTQTIIGDIVSLDYRTAVTFTNFKIDFCCNGNRTLQQAAIEADADILELTEKLGIVLSTQKEKSADYESWSLDFLADYIYQNHHKYVEERIPVIKQYLEKLCKVHGANHPELFEIKDLFFEGAGDLAQHMKKEELILFPFIKKMMYSENENIPLALPAFETVENPIQMMQEEHDNEGERYRKISALSNEYNPPLDACTTYKTAYLMLKEFEQDLHLHIHLESNILFKKALALEKKLTK